MICSKYFKTSKDYINLICVNSKFKETTEKFRYNPIPIKNLKLFPRIQTQHLYGDSIKMLKYKQITKYEFWGEHNYLQYTKLKKKSNIKWHGIEYTRLNRVRFGDKIPDEVTTLGCNCFGSGGGYYPNTSSAKGCFGKCGIRRLKLGLPENCY
ncbi:Leucine rich repeat protein bspa family [Entamoeba marina]